MTAISLVQKAIARMCSISAEELVSSSRRQEIVTSRKMVYLVCRQVLGSSFLRIARAFNKDNHTSVISAYKDALRRWTPEQLLEKLRPYFFGEIDAIIAHLMDQVALTRERLKSPGVSRCHEKDLEFYNEELRQALKLRRALARPEGGRNVREVILPGGRRYVFKTPRYRKAA